jgi:hypothetical protein
MDTSPVRRLQSKAGTSTLFRPSVAQVVTLKLKEYASGLFSTDPVLSPVPISTTAEQMRSDTTSYSRIAEDMAASGKSRSLHLWVDLEEQETGFSYGTRTFLDAEIRFLEPLLCANVTALIVHAWKDVEDSAPESPVDPEVLQEKLRKKI